MSDQDPEQPKKKRSLLRRVIVVGGLSVVLLLGGVLALVATHFDDIVNAQKDEHLPRVEAILGRKVAIGDIKTSFIPLGVEVQNVVVKGRTEGEDPLLSVKKITFSAGIWQAIKSAGTELSLNAMVVDGLTVNLIREADGSLSYEDVLKRLSEGPPPEEAPKPLDPEVIKFVKQLQLKRVALQNARFRLLDKATGGAPAETAINKLLVEMNDVVLASPFELHVAAAVFADAENFDLRVKAGPIPIGEEGKPFPVESIAVKSTGIDLSKIMPYLPAGTPVAIQSAQFKADLKVEDPLAAKGRIKVKGSLGVDQLSVGLVKAGKPFNLKLSPNVEVDQKAGIVDLTGFELAFDDMVIKANGRVEGLNDARPSFKDLRVQTTNLDLGRLLAMLPDAASGLPKGSDIGGIFKLDVAASGDPSAQDIKADVNLDEAKLMIPGTFAKPAGTPLNTQVDAHVTSKDLDLKSLKVAVGPLALALAGTVKNFENPSFDIKGNTGRFDINGLVRMLPNVSGAVPPDVKIAGSMGIDVKLVGNPSDIDSQVVIELAGADLAVPGTTIKGGGRIELKAKGDPASSIGVNLDAALSALGIKAGDAFAKPAGTPFAIQVAATKGGNSVNISSLKLDLGPLGITGGGSLVPGGPVDIKANIGRFSVKELAALLPALKETPISAATLGMSLGLKGNPSKMSTIHAELSDFYFAQGRSSLTGKASVENPDAPKIRFDFNAPVLDLDEMFPPSGEEAPAEEGGGEIPPIVKKLDVQGSIRIGQGVASAFPFTKFVATLTMQNGKAKFSKLDFDAYEGHFSAAPTSADVGAAVPSFDVNVSFRNVNAQKLLAEQADLPQTLSGRMSTKIKVAGKGKVWETMSKTMAGTLGATVLNGKFHGADVNEAIVQPVAAKVPGGLIKKPKGVGGMAFKKLEGQFEIVDGKLKLKEPMKMDTAEGPLELTGYIGLDKALNLTGKLGLSPKTIGLMTGNKVKVKEHVPVGLTIGGTVDDPKFTKVEVKELAEILIKELAKSMGLAKLEEAKAKAEEAARKAEAMARQKVAAAKAKANAAKKKAQAAADKKKKELERKAAAEKKKREKQAKDKAKKEAKKKMKGLF